MTYSIDVPYICEKFTIPHGAIIADIPSTSWAVEYGSERKWIMCGSTISLFKFIFDGKYYDNIISNEIVINRMDDDIIIDAKPSILIKIELRQYVKITIIYKNLILTDIITYYQFVSMMLNIKTPHLFGQFLGHVILNLSERDAVQVYMSHRNIIDDMTRKGYFDHPKFEAFFNTISHATSETLHYVQ